MAEYPFFICKKCCQVFLTSEIIHKNNEDFCPNCNCQLRKTNTECYNLDPFDPRTWPFGKQVRISEAVHPNSLTPQFFAHKSASEWSLALIILGFFFSGVLFLMSNEYGQALVWGALVSLVLAIIGIILRFRKTYISINNQNVYLHRGFFHDSDDIVVNRQNIRINYHRKIDETRGGSYDDPADRAYAFQVNIDVLGSHGQLVSRVLFSETRSDEMEAIQDIIWLTMYIKYAFHPFFSDRNAVQRLLLSSEKPGFTALPVLNTNNLLSVKNLMDDKISIAGRQGMVSLNMKTHSFVFCNKCLNMCLSSEIIRNVVENPVDRSTTEVHFCPNCKCELDKNKTAFYNLDTDNPASWPFANQVSVSAPIRANSATPQFLIKNSKADWPIALISIGIFCVIVALIISLRAGHLFIWFILINLGIAGIGLLFSLIRTRISIDAQNVYVHRGFFNKERFDKIIPRQNVNINIKKKVRQVRQKSSNKYKTIFSIKIVLEEKLENKVISKVFISNLDSESAAMDEMRWLTTYIKYAYKPSLMDQLAIQGSNLNAEEASFDSYNDENDN